MQRAQKSACTEQITECEVVLFVLIGVCHSHDTCCVQGILHSQISLIVKQATQLIGTYTRSTRAYLDSIAHASACALVDTSTCTH